MNNLTELDAWAKSILASLGSVERKRLMSKMAKHLRDENRKRMAAQTDPDGKSWTPRKKRSGKVAKKRKMFKGLRKIRFLKYSATPNSLTVGFTGNAGNVARIHHYGLRQRLGKQNIQYSERRLIGISKDDRDQLQNIITDHIKSVAKA